jgi:hypothetical protein
MADLGFDGMISVWWVPTIADITAPKAATEIAAAGSVCCTRASPRTASTRAPARTRSTPRRWPRRSTRRSSAAATSTASRSPTSAVTPSARSSSTRRCLQGVGLPRGAPRCRRRHVAPAAAQKVEVYPAQCGEPQYASPAPNALQTVTVPLTLTADPRSSSNPATTSPDLRSHRRGPAAAWRCGRPASHPPPGLPPGARSRPSSSSSRCRRVTRTAWSARPGWHPRGARASLSPSAPPH